MSDYTGLEVAVIGMSGKFPGADNVGLFWENLKKGIESVEFFTVEELLAEGEEKHIMQDSRYVNANAYLKDKENFDADFFGYLPDEARLMDPQMRLFHQICWEALEDAGCNIRDTKNKIGLFAGASPNTNWEMYAGLANKDGLVDEFSAFQLRNSRFLTTKISYAFNLKGISMFIDTACSTSLTAVHQACRSILTGDCNIAIAGGVAISNKSKKGYLYQEGMINSIDGHCKAFDSEASGTVGGEGAGAVILKSLKNAIKDRDNIYAVIRGTGINNDGNNKVGYTAPSVDGQMEAIMNAHRWAKTDPNTIGYIETHGTGTKLGDPVEITALKSAFNTDKKQFCAIGSVKTNIGHLDTASGVAGLIKTVLALKHKQLPPSLHYKNPNPAIDFTQTPFYVNTKLLNWKQENTPLRAGVSSFGIGGTNVHLILEEAPAKVKGSPGRVNQLVLLSGKTPNALKRNINKFTDYLQSDTNDELADITYTLQVGREPFSYRKAMLCSSKEEALQLLSSAKNLADDEFASIPNNRTPEIAFMFSGQGSQYQNMCIELYEKEPVFKNIVDECLTVISQKYGKDLREIMFCDQNPDSTFGIDETENTQPALFIIEYALAHLLQFWGIVPDVMIGHSIGEYVAACISGVFTFEDALHIVVKRGELMQKVPRGKMLSIAISEKELLPLLKDKKNISLAAINSNELCVVSGDEVAIESFGLLMEEAGYLCRPIRTSHAFHSHMMDEILEAFTKEFAHINLNAPKKSFISNLSGKIAVREEVMTASYWVRHLRETVRFSQGIETVLENNQITLLEIGPGKVLSYLASTNSKKDLGHTVINLVRSAKEEGTDSYHLLSAIGKLWEHGVSPQWSGFYENEQRNKVSLPTYDFEKVSYPVNVDAVRLIKEQFTSGYTDKNSDVGINVATWKRSLLPNGGLMPENTDCFLVFSGNENFSNSIINYLSSAGKKVIEVRFGSSFKEVSKEVLEADPQRLPVLWEYLEQSSIKVQQILYCAALDHEAGAVNYNAIDGKLNEGYIDLCYIIQSLPHIFPHEKMRIMVFNNHIARVFEEDQLNPLKATILGPVKVTPSEILQVNCKLIDIQYPFEENSISETHLAKLINEMFYESDSNPLVAYRNGQRWIPCYETLQDESELNSGVQIIPEGVYIITGGLGGMGFSIAQDLVFKKGANVILLHRSPFPDRTQWADYLTNLDVSAGEEAEKGLKIETLIKMEATGCKVILLQADVSVEEDVKNVLTLIKNSYNKINGLIWAAGEVDHGGIILNRTRQSLINYSTSKIQGVLLFEKYLNFSELDFIGLFSSIGNVFYQSKFGQVAYNAANEFLESYASYLEQKLQIHAFAINWCDWFDVGMTVKKIQQESGHNIAKINHEISDGIYPEEGISVFYSCLESKAISSTVYRGSLTKAIKHYQSEYKKIKKEMTLPAVMVANKPEEETVISVEDIVTEIFSQFFGKPVIGKDEDFFDLGGDSLKGMTLVSRINHRIGSSLSVGNLYSHSTIKALSQLLSKADVHHNGIEITKAPKKESYRLSSAQKRMYFLQILNNESLAYNEVEVLQAQGFLDKARIKKSLEKLLKRHESLRTYFEWVNGEIAQKIVENVHLDVEEFISDRAGIEAVIKAFIRPFDLTTAPLFRFGIIRLSEKEHILMLDMHHIITDGLSKNILIYDFLSFYNGQKLPKLKLQYKDYAEWQQSEPEQQRILKQKDFWMQTFADEIPILELPLDKVRPLHKSNVGDSIEFNFEVADTIALKALAENESVSMFVVLLSVYNVMLSKLSNQYDIIVGTPTSGRLNADVEGILGMFVNVLPLRNKPMSNLNFTEFLANVKSNTLNCLDNQNYQFEDMIEALGIKPNSSRDALFDALFDYQNFAESSINEIRDLNFSSYFLQQKVSKFDLTLKAKEKDNQTALVFEYRTDLFEKETITQFVKYFKKIVSDVISDQYVKLSDIDVLDEQDRNELLVTFNDTKTAVIDKTVVTLISDQVQKTPDNIAIVFEDKKISYKEADDLSSQLSLSLRNDYGIQKGDMVGILLNRSDWSIITVLAILKSGGVCIPIDSELPSNRKAFIVNDTALKLLITDTAFLFELDFYNGSVLSIDVEFEPGAQQYDNETINIVANDLAYIIYTSGSTGQPKGVMVEHGSLTNYLVWAKHCYLNENLSNRNFGLFTSMSFDLTITSLLLPLISGGLLHVFHNTRSVRDLLENYLNSTISCIKLTPSHISVLGNLDIRTDKIEIAIVGGEELRKEHVEILRKINPLIRIFNEYGPTETTVGCTFYEVKSTEEEILIGRPIDNTEIYILDSHNRLQAKGVPGELCVGGAGLARGYLNQPELTTEKFIPNPFREGELIYKTGDLARWLHEGTIDYKGRIDDQVKVNGYRIELGEIETQISQYGQDIKQVSVLVTEEKNGGSIVAYFVSDNEIDKSGLRNYLLKNLPEYMVPGFYIKLKSIPLSSSGKIDRTALPSITGEDLITTTYVAPRNETEEKLIQIVATILECKDSEIGINDSFFSLGMNSLKMLIMVNEIKAQLQLVINISLLFEFSSVSELSHKINELIGETKKGEDENNDGDEDLLDQYDDFLEHITD